jgi:predicted DNA-binding protein (MmcQ/YjbR family)
MKTDEVRAFFNSKPGAVEDFPFGEEILVFKVADKMFGLMNLDNDPLSINLKCDPDLAVELRNQFTSIIPGYHMNKKHWNTLILDGSIPEVQLKVLIDHSYDLVFSKLTKKRQKEIENLG